MPMGYLRFCAGEGASGRDARLGRGFNRRGVRSTALVCGQACGQPSPVADGRQGSDRWGLPRLRGYWQKKEGGNDTGDF